MIVPVLSENPVLPTLVQNNGKLKEKEKENKKEKEKEMEKEDGHFIGKVTSFYDPYYKIIYTDGDEEEMTRSSVF